MIELINVWKSYKFGKNKLEVLKGISLKISKGEFVTIMGPSGSGKTTLLNLIAGLDKPESGEIKVNGFDISKASDDERALWRRYNIGYVPQFFFLIQFLNVLENVELAARLAKIKNPKLKAKEALEKVGLLDKMNKYPSELSGGEIQRVAIARAIVHDPPLIIADEPTAFLDSENKRKIVEILLSIWEKGKTVLLATHDSFLARKRVIEILDGVIKGEKYE